MYNLYNLLWPLNIWKNTYINGLVVVITLSGLFIFLLETISIRKKFNQISLKAQTFTFVTNWEVF